VKRAKEGQKEYEGLSLRSTPAGEERKGAPFPRQSYHTGSKSKQSQQQQSLAVRLTGLALKPVFSCVWTAEGFWRLREGGIPCCWPCDTCWAGSIEYTQQMKGGGEGTGRTGVRPV